jgi:polyphosphate kinase
VEIDLIVRGICALRPGVRGVSDRIRVRSIVGRFLEHSRIFYFQNAGAEEIYTGSADWMARNLYERVEVLTPVRDAFSRDRIRQEMLEAYLCDDAKARLLQRDGSYIRISRRRSAARTQPVPGFNAQEFLIALAEGKASIEALARLAPPRIKKIHAKKER